MVYRKASRKAPRKASRKASRKGSRKGSRKNKVGGAAGTAWQAPSVWTQPFTYQPAGTQPAGTQPFAHQSFGTPPAAYQQPVFDGGEATPLESKSWGGWATFQFNQMTPAARSAARAQMASFRKGPPKAAIFVSPAAAAAAEAAGLQKQKDQAMGLEYLPTLAARAAADDAARAAGLPVGIW